MYTDQLTGFQSLWEKRFHKRAPTQVISFCRLNKTKADQQKYDRESLIKLKPFLHTVCPLRCRVCFHSCWNFHSLSCLWRCSLWLPSAVSQSVTNPYSHSRFGEFVLFFNKLQNRWYQNNGNTLFVDWHQFDVSQNAYLILWGAWCTVWCFTLRYL